MIYLLMWVIYSILTFVLDYPESFVASKSALLATVWEYLATFGGFALSLPISTIAVSLVYYDQRVRKEAFDVQLMIEAIEQEPQSQSVPAPIG